VVLIYPAERMNHITANTILKSHQVTPGFCWSVKPRTCCCPPCAAAAKRTP
jgi:hypothetical protein